MRFSKDLRKLFSKMHVKKKDLNLLYVLKFLVIHFLIHLPIKTIKPFI